MCIIIDANKRADFLNKKPAMEPVWQWLKGGMEQIVYTGEKTYSDEINLRIFLQGITQANLTPKKINQKDVVKAIEELEKNENGYRSNDPHILALAKVSGARVVVTADKKLRGDLQKQGADAYENKKDAHLLDGYSCPK